MPVITTAAITALLMQLAKTGLEKAFESAGEKVSSESIDWLKSIFTKKGKERKELKKLRENPESTARLNAAKSIVEISLEENPNAKSYLEEILTKTSANWISIKDSKNVNLGNIESKDGDIHLGDNYGK